MRFADSIDMNKDYPSSWAELMDPTKDEPGYPRLMLENRAYQTRVFRKVHLEVGIRQDNIQVSLRSWSGSCAGNLDGVTVLKSQSPGGD